MDAVGRVVALDVAASACWISGSWMRTVSPAPRLAGVGVGIVVSTVSAGAALVGGGEGVALGVTVGCCSVGGLGAGSAVGAVACAGALVGAAGASTGDMVGVFVGVGETVGVAVMIGAIYGVAVAGGGAAGGSVAVGVTVGVGVRLAVGVAVAGGQISANVRSGGWAPCAMVLSPQAQPLTSPLCTTVLLAPACENCQWSPTSCEYDQYIHTSPGWSVQWEKHGSVGKLLPTVSILQTAPPTPLYSKITGRLLARKSSSPVAWPSAPRSIQKVITRPSPKSITSPA